MYIECRIKLVHKYFEVLFVIERWLQPIGELDKGAALILARLKALGFISKPNNGNPML